MKKFKMIPSAMMALVFAFTIPMFSTVAAQSATPEASPIASPAATPKVYDKTGWPKELDCGLFGGADAASALTGAQPIADYLESYLGIPMKYEVGTSYNAVIESMASNHTNCGTVGPFSYILAVQEAGAEALAVQVTPGTASGVTAVYDPTAAPSYYSVISVKKKSGIRTLPELKGKTLSFVDPASTSGYLIPSSELQSAGLDPKKDLKTVFAGDHPTSVYALWNDKVDAAASTEDTLVNLAAEGQIDYCGFKDGIIGKVRTQDEINALWDSCPDGSIVPILYSAPIPNTPFAVSKNLPESLKQAITDALVSIKDNPELVAKIGYWYVDPTQTDPSLKNVDALYDPLREIAKQLNLDLKSFGN
ncbi:MAG TPA: phosphate/phosphite/phosphonate ABC transporter substrate-binding protein [Thermomicrobiales bacterium]|nr:phosphate/phosphite/phosphonate ABC transporter substrate-binding protein [Thermomicrobiales bacterium]